MVEARKSLLIVYFFSVLLPCSVFCGDQVPLIAWSSTESLLSTPRIDAGHIVTQQSLKEDYLDILPMDHPHNLFLIVMDKLSIDDITRHSNAHSSNPNGGSLSHLKSAMQSSASHLVLPAAETFDVEGDLKSRISGQVFELTSPSLKDIKLDNTKSNLIIMRLSSSTSDSRQAAMSALDQALLQVLGQLPGRFAPYTVVLTARQPSRVALKKPQPVNIGRHLLASGDSDFIFVNFTTEHCQAFFYSTNISLDLMNVTGANRMEDVSLPKDNDWQTTDSECIRNGEELQFVISHSDLNDQDISFFSLNMHFNKTTGLYKFWYLESVKVTFTDQETNYTFAMDSADFEPKALSTPVGLSYHCSDMPIHETQKANETKYDNKVKLIIKEFQIQPFKIKNDQFSEANDCVGYFTPGIWMGLFLTLILLMILGSGMAMLANLKVMDKFDDPKGKTITVNTAE